MAEKPMIAADLIPEELQKIEFQIRLKQELIKGNRELMRVLQAEYDELLADMAVLEEKKYRLFTGRGV